MGSPGQDAQQLLGVYEADDVIEVALEHRVTRVRRAAQKLQYLLGGRLHRQSHHAVARHHHLAHRQVLELQQAAQHARLPPGHVPLGSLSSTSDWISCSVCARARSPAVRTRSSAGCRRWRRPAAAPAGPARCGWRAAVLAAQRRADGMLQRHGLGDHLSHHHVQVGEQRHRNRRRQAVRCRAAHHRRAEQRHQRLCHGLLGVHPQPQAGEGDARLRRGHRAVQRAEAAGEGQHLAGAAIAAVGQRLQARAPRSHQRQLRGHADTVDEDQQRHHQREEEPGHEPSPPAAASSRHGVISTISMRWPDIPSTSSGGPAPRPRRR